MTELTREIYDAGTDKLIEAIDSLAKEIRHSHRTVVGSTNGSTWTLLFGVGALMFGMMSPLYIMVMNSTETMNRHIDLPGHSTATERLAELKISLQEVETQFNGVKLRLDVAEAAMLRDNGREEAGIAEMATLREKVRALETKP